jgi:L-malate glycosyltransferase
MKAEKPLILIVENSTAVTGALKSIVRSSYDSREFFNFIFVIPRGSTAKSYIEQHGFRVYEMKMVEIQKRIWSLILYFPALLVNTSRLASLIRKNNVSLIVNNDFYNLLPAAYVLFGGSVEYICYVRFLPSRFPGILVYFWCKAHALFAHTVVAVSNVVRAQLPGWLKNVEVVYNELPLGEIPYVPASSKVILYCANYITGKGQEYALQSFAQISHRYPEWKLRFVGGDMGLKKNKSFKESLKSLSRSLKIESQVEWHDFEHNISSVYQSSSFVLNFSESESFSMTCLEAMFFGRPVVATRSGGPAEIIDDQVTGILVDLRDINAMAKAIEYLINHPQEREKMAQRAYNIVRSKFSLANTTVKLQALYRKALGQ